MDGRWESMDAWARGLAGKPIGQGKDWADRPTSSRPCLASHRDFSGPSSLFKLFELFNLFKLFKYKTLIFSRVSLFFLHFDPLGTPPKSSIAQVKYNIFKFLDCAET